MILIADSGSTKTDWCVLENGKPFFRIKTAGMNPFFQTEKEMVSELREHLLPHLKPEQIEEVHFYGAGCIPEKSPFVGRVLKSVLGISAGVESDLLGAARSLCGHQAGIACILGTGSNSCFYDGKTIVSNVPPLGYVLGDEGGGAYLGRCLVREYLRGSLSIKCEEAFRDTYGLGKAEILDRVYKQPFPNRFLAGFAAFLPPYIGEDGENSLRSAVRDCFSDFFRHCVKRYDYEKQAVHAIGSIAWYFREMIQQVADQEGITIGLICQSPMEGLVKYHTQ